jgi:hypothetical protein
MCFGVGQRVGQQLADSYERHDAFKNDTAHRRATPAHSRTSTGDLADLRGRRQRRLAAASCLALAHRMVD